MATEAEIVGDGDLDRLLGDVLDVWHVVEIAVRIRAVEVERRRDRARLQHLARDHSLDSAGGAEEVAGRPLGGGDLDLTRVGAERAAEKRERGGAGVSAEGGDAEETLAAAAYI